MSQSKARHIAKNLNDQAPIVAPILLPNGKRAGNYWKAGDVNGNPGGSLYLNLNTGKWSDAATNEHGDLLDLIATQNNATITQAMDIAEKILAGKIKMSAAERQQPTNPARNPEKTHRAVCGLWNKSQPLNHKSSQHARAYLKQRGIPEEIVQITKDLRYIPAAWVRIDDITHTKPALIAAIRNSDQELTGLQRTFLHQNQPLKADMEDPRRGMGLLKGSACYLKPAGTPLIIGEGIETSLSVLAVQPTAACAAAISSQHLQLVNLHKSYNYVVILTDNDKAGKNATQVLANRLRAEGRTVLTITSTDHDFNDDLNKYGIEEIKKQIRLQIYSKV